MTPAPLLALLSFAAVAQTREADPDLTPLSGLAVEDGPQAVWVNPANLAYDADFRWQIATRYDPTAGRAPSGIGATLGIGGVSAGLRWMRRPDAADDFALDLGAGLRLPKRIALGAAVHFHLEGAERDHVSFDAAASWRPLPWMGVSLSSRHIGGPGEERGNPPETAGGLAVRPVGDAVELGADLAYTFGGPLPGPRGVFTARVRPVEGLFLRAAVDTHGTFGAALEVFVGGVGVAAGGGAGAAPDADGLVGHALAWLGSDEPGLSIAQPRHQVLDVEVRDVPAYEPDRRLLGRAPTSWIELLEQFDVAASNRHVRGLTLRLGDLRLEPARWQELRARIMALQASDKPVVVHLTDGAGLGALYAASAARTVLAHPGAVLRLNPPVREQLYLGGLLDALGVEVDVARTGPFKSAAEPLTRRGPSPEDLQQQSALLHAWREEVTAALVEGRGRPRDVVEGWMRAGPVTARAGASLGLIDGVAYNDTVDDALPELFGHRVHVVSSKELPRRRSAWDPPAQVAVIHVLGTLVPGETPTGAGAPADVTGAVTVTSQLERAARDPKVRAVVLRVDSPGGAMVAAQDVSRAIDAVRATGKPVVASMGDVAASGGYWIAAASDAVWASPDTVTGSIGVIAIHPTFGGLARRLGAEIDQLPADAPPPMDSPYTPWDPWVQSRMQAVLDDAYDQFVAHVAARRGLTPEAVHAVGQGRVWSGRDARQAGLVDHMGGVLEAVRDARRRANIPDRRRVDVVAIRPRSGLIEILLPELSRLRVATGSPTADAVLAVTDTAFGAAATWLHLSQHPPETPWLLEPTRLNHAPR